MNEDIYTFSETNMALQIEQGSYELGFYRVKFYSVNGMPSAEKTATLSQYHLFPSGGTLRDENMNIVFYSAKFDTYKGFVPPHKRK